MCTLSGLTPVCHSTACGSVGLPRSSQEDPPSDPGSSADEGYPQTGAGWTGTGSPMSVGTGYTAREYCDGQTLASRRRWNYPPQSEWFLVSRLPEKCVETHGSPELLMRLALGKVDSSSCGDREISELKTGLKGLGLELRTSAEDRHAELPFLRVVAFGGAGSGDCDCLVRKGSSSWTRGSALPVCQHFTRPRRDGAFENSRTRWYTWRRERRWNMHDGKTTQLSRHCLPKSQRSWKTRQEEASF